MENEMKLKHTPGPWLVDVANYDGLSLPIRAVVDTGETLVIAEALNDVRELDRVYKGNAIVIASAPSLFAESAELIRNAETMGDGYMSVRTQDIEALEAVLNTIRRAK